MTRSATPARRGLLVPLPEASAEPLPACADLEPFDYPTDRHPVQAYLRTLSRGSSRVTMEQVARDLARLASGDRIPWERFPWHRLDRARVLALREAIAERWTPPGANKHLTGLKRILDEAFDLGWIDADTYARARRVPPVRGRSGLGGRALAQKEIRTLVEGCLAAGGPKGMRDAAITLVLYATGARRRELCRLRWPEDLDLERRECTLRTKGGRQRTADLPAGLVELLERWLRARGRAPGPLFAHVDRFGQVDVRELAPGSLWKILEQRARELGVERFSPHDLRRTYATALLDAGVDLHIVQEMLDHAQIATTAKYDPGRSKRRRAAALRLPMPLEGGR